MSALPRTSRAAVLVDYIQTLEIREIEIPPLEPGAILVRGGSRHCLWDRRAHLPR